MLCPQGAITDSTRCYECDTIIPSSLAKSTTIALSETGGTMVVHFCERCHSAYGFGGDIVACCHVCNGYFGLTDGTPITIRVKRGSAWESFDRWLCKLCQAVI